MQVATVTFSPKPPPVLIIPGHKFTHRLKIAVANLKFGMNVDNVALPFLQLQRIFVCNERGFNQPATNVVLTTFEVH